MEMNLAKESAIVEAVLFLDSEPLTEDAISKISELSVDVVKLAIEELHKKYENENSGVELVQITGGWVLAPKKDIWFSLREHYGKKSEGRLSRAAMETLSIIAYKQPITRSEIEDIRGVSVDNMIRLLLERNLIKEDGKKDAPGRPTQFATTKEFLKFFRLNSLEELPKLEEQENERFELAR